MIISIQDGFSHCVFINEVFNVCDTCIPSFELDSISIFAVQGNHVELSSLIDSKELPWLEGYAPRRYSKSEHPYLVCLRDYCFLDQPCF